MNDNLLRAALKRKLNARYSNDPETVIIDELGLRHGAARVDVVVINDALHGYELKSDKDTLERLPHQSSVFSSILDRITLVVGLRHAEEARNIVPEWWGVQLAEKGPRGGIRFSCIRRARKNPSPDTLATAKLLWRDEALDLLHRLDTARGYRFKPRAAIYARLTEVAQHDLIRAEVRHRLRSRIGWRSDAR